MLSETHPREVYPLDEGIDEATAAAEVDATDTALAVARTELE